MPTVVANGKWFVSDNGTISVTGMNGEVGAMADAMRVLGAARAMKTALEAVRDADTLPARAEALVMVDEALAQTELKS